MHNILLCTENQKIFQNRAYLGEKKKNKKHVIPEKSYLEKSHTLFYLEACCQQTTVLTPSDSSMSNITFT